MFLLQMWRDAKAWRALQRSFPSRWKGKAEFEAWNSFVSSPAYDMLILNLMDGARRDMDEGGRDALRAHGLMFAATLMVMKRGKIEQLQKEAQEKLDDPDWLIEQWRKDDKLF